MKRFLMFLFICLATCCNGKGDDSSSSFHIVGEDDDDFFKQDSSSFVKLKPGEQLEDPVKPKSKDAGTETSAVAKKDAITETSRKPTTKETGTDAKKRPTTKDAGQQTENANKNESNWVVNMISWLFMSISKFFLRK
jgi:hypothetical protein